MTQTGRPLVLKLPEGHPPVFDTTIPKDLPGWFWLGRYLTWSDELGIATGIDTATFGIPGVFEQARLIEKQRQKIQKREPSYQQEQMF